LHDHEGLAVRLDLELPSDAAIKGPRATPRRIFVSDGCDFGCPGVIVDFTARFAEPAPVDVSGAAARLSGLYWVERAAPAADKYVRIQLSAIQDDRAAEIADAEGVLPADYVPYEIPEDFPLNLNMVSQGEFADSIPLPSSDGRAGVASKDPCYEYSLRPAVTDRLRVAETAPEYLRERELIVFASADEAVAHMQTLRSAFEFSCGGEFGQPGRAVFTHPRANGYDYTAYTLYYPGQLGNGVYQVGRVGAAVLVELAAGESAGPASPEYLRFLAGDYEQLMAELCLFTVTGC
jgi:hypothetical protein